MDVMAFDRQVMQVDLSESIVDRHLQTGYGAAVVSDGSNSYMVTRTGHRGGILRHFHVHLTASEPRHSHIQPQHISGTAIRFHDCAAVSESEPICFTLLRIATRLGKMVVKSSKFLTIFWREHQQIIHQSSTNHPQIIHKSQRSTSVHRIPAPRCSCITSNLLTCDASGLQW